MATLVNYDIFWHRYLDHCELQRLEGIFDQLDFSETVEAIQAQRNFSGRQDWPIEAMLRALFAMSVLQHRSTESFRRELMRNPTLMMALGFKLKAKADQRCDSNQFLPYPVPSSAAFSRLRRKLMEVEKKTGVLRKQFERQRERFAEQCSDYGRHTGFDGKAVESHSTGRKLASRTDPVTGQSQTSDPDAAWGCHRQYRTDDNAREQVTEKVWFGYSLTVLGDVSHELPIDFNLAPACDNENPHCEALLERFVGSDLGRRCETFVADRGLDNDKIRKKLHERDILALIDTRSLWQEHNLDPDQLKAPTRSLDANVYDTMLRTECGDLYCRCPESGHIRLMHYQGYEKKRATLKWVCPAAAFEFDCQGKDECYRLGQVRAGAKSRVVRTKVDAGNLRQHPALPPSTLKWKRLYRKRSAMERINSRVADGFMLHSHYLRGRQSMELKITISMTVMLAAANFAMQLNKPEQIRSLVLSLAA